MIIYIDFDGTITKTDTTDDLLERFAVGNFNEIEQEWLCGKIGSKECMSKQYDMIQAKEAEIQQALENIEIDPFFVEFCHLFHAKAKLIIISDGIDYAIDAILKKYNLNLTASFSNHLTLKQDKVEISFPYEMNDCKVKAGLCKCGIYKEYTTSSNKSILIGNGKSDTCLAHEVDLVFAKDYLLTYCQQNKINHIEFNHFSDLMQHMNSILSN